MQNIIKRDEYLNRIIDRKENGLIKVITGIRRCGKSFLLFNLFYDYLIESGVKEEQIITIALDDDTFVKYRDPDELSKYIRGKIVNSDMYYILIDEVQYAITKDELKNPENIKLYNVLNGLMRLRNVDIYVTGSNSKMLTKDVLTAFRGRGDEVRVYPISFKEYYSFVGGDKSDAYEEYALYGGMPLVLTKKSDAEKMNYLHTLFTEVYFKDIVERYDIELPDVLSELTDDLCSSVGSLTNASKISNTLQIDKAKRILEVTERGFYAPAEMIQFSYIIQAERTRQRGCNRFKLAVVQQKPANAEFHRIGRWEVPASAPRLGAYLAFLRNLQKDIAVFLVLLGLRGGDGRTDCTVKLHHRQLCHLSHRGVVLPDANKKVRIFLFKTMGNEVIALKAAVGNDERLLCECVTLQHIHQRADFVFLWLGLYNQIVKGAA